MSCKAVRIVRFAMCAPIRATAYFYYLGHKTGGVCPRHAKGCPESTPTLGVAAPAIDRVSMRSIQERSNEILKKRRMTDARPVWRRDS
jgi:hypothetical protein